jgi:dTDP-4-dehydrorhamnose 3,5-epimerase-like enzyme
MLCQTLPPGVILQNLSPSFDNRGCFTEVFREAWDPSIDPIQWGHAVFAYWDPTDELRCLWSDDPELKIPWNIRTPLISESDAHAPSYKELIKALVPWQGILY